MKRLRIREPCSSKKPMKYDPSKSEAYKALQEEALGDQVQEIKQPARTGVFSPQKANHNRVRNLYTIYSHLSFTFTFTIFLINNF